MSCVMAPRANWKGYLKLSLVPARRKKLKRAS
jgi:hypothetical protein